MKRRARQLVVDDDDDNGEDNQGEDSNGEDNNGEDDNGEEDDNEEEDNNEEDDNGEDDDNGEHNTNGKDNNGVDNNGEDNNEEYDGDGDNAGDDSHEEDDSTGGVAVVSTAAASSGMFDLLIQAGRMFDCCNTNVGLSGAALLVRNRNRVARKDGKSKYVVDRVQGFVKNHLFRKVKFITKEKMLVEVMEVVEETEEGVTDDDVKRMAFRKLYKSSVMEALNARRSSCDQMGCKIVHRHLARTWTEEQGEGIPPSLNIKTLMTLRRAVTDDEKTAIQWFFAEFMECVCGKRVWGKQKYSQLISEAVSLDTGELILTISDEAFGLLLIDNYMGKWVKKFHIQRKGILHRSGRLDGLYTAATKGNSAFGGWTRQGRHQFNLYCRLVQEDRHSPGSVGFERAFLAAMQKTPEGEKIHQKLLRCASRNGRGDSDEDSEEDIYYEALVQR
jgi:hypothetical protein